MKSEGVSNMGQGAGRAGLIPRAHPVSCRRKIFLSFISRKLVLQDVPPQPPEKLVIPKNIL